MYARACGDFSYLFESHKKFLIHNLGVSNLGKWYWYLIAICLPILIFTLSYFLGYEFGFLTFTKKMNNISWIYFIYLTIRFFLVNAFGMGLLFAFAEELGWRGYLQSKLSDSLGDSFSTYLLIGLLWSTWHYNFIFSGNYFSSCNHIIDALLFTAETTLAGAVFSWLRYQSGSLWPVVILHSSWNSVLWIFQMRSHPTGQLLNYFAGESGVLNIVLWFVVFYILYKKTSRVDAIARV